MRRLLTTLAIAAVAATGCGGDDEEGDGASERTVTVPANSTLRVTAEEYSFDPGRATVRGAGRLTIRLRNAGSLAHNLKLFRDGREIGGTPTFPGGRTESGTVNLEHGSYEMICTVGDHAELGMKGELTVR
jgi:plastocyanin